MSAGVRLPAALAALSGAVAVAIGAFAAHGIRDPAAKGWLETGGHYQLAHAVAALLALVVAPTRGARAAAWCFLAGGLLFAGSLAGMALAGWFWLGPVTPIGGTLLIVGWLVLAITIVRVS